MSLWNEQGNVVQDETDARRDAIAVLIALLAGFVPVLFTEPHLALSLVIGLSVYIGIRVITT